MDAAAIRAEGLCWSAPGAGPILKGISFTLAPGRVLGVVGANGAGKSTLLRLLYRFHRPASGRVLIDGRDLWSLPAREAARSIAAVLQEHPSDFALTIREIVALGRIPHRRSFARGGAHEDAIIARVLDQLGLTGMAGRALGTLSGGEKQRVMVARALAQEPRLLILDEPTNHLDIRHQLDVLAQMRGLGVTVITSLHDLNLAARYCDDLLVLDQGRAIAFGPPQEALTPGIVSRAFDVAARREKLAPSGQPHFTFHLNDCKEDLIS